MKTFLHAFRPSHALLCVSLTFAGPLAAQQPMMAAALGASSSEANDVLPESPGAVLRGSPDAEIATPDVVIFEAPLFDQATAAGMVAPKYHRRIKQGETAQTLSAGDKFVLAFRSRATVGSFAGTFFAAGIQQINNSRPHYGVDRGAFGQRLGASALTGLSRSVFSNGLYASLFRQDPRYYVMGNNRGGFGKRAIYSASRVVLVGAPGEHSHLNWSNLAGSASSSALANAYYPTRDQNFGKSATSFASSLGTQAAGNLLDELLSDVIRKIRHKN